MKSDDATSSDEPNKKTKKTSEWIKSNGILKISYRLWDSDSMIASFMGVPTVSQVNYVLAKFDYADDVEFVQKFIDDCLADGSSVSNKIQLETHYEVI